jgi:hypothetical protein
MTTRSPDDLTGAFIYPANDNIGAPGNDTLRISARIHPAALRIRAELCFMLHANEVIFKGVNPPTKAVEGLASRAPLLIFQN